MDQITSFPGDAYDYIHGNYGTIGLIVAGVCLVVAMVSVFIWLDRRK